MFLVKSKFTLVGHFSFWYLSLMSLLAIYLTLGVAFNFSDTVLVKNKLTDIESIIVLIVFPILIVIAVAQIKILCKTYIFDSENQNLTISHYFGLRKRVLPFSHFDGYIDTFMKSSRGDFRVFYLIRNGEPSLKFSGMVLSNMDEIEKALGQFKYLGFKRFNFKWSLKIFFRRLIFE